jgi:hypothetical protein
MSWIRLVVVASVLVAGCRSAPPAAPASQGTFVPDGSVAPLSGGPAQPQAAASTSDAAQDLAIGAVAGGFAGFDRNDYPGDAAMAAMKKTFAFTGYWVTPPPGETANNWAGKRLLLKQQGWGFLVLADGRFDKEILAAQKKGTTPEQLGQQDAAKAIASTKTEGFPAHTILFLDQEEGGRLLDEQAQYLLAWTEAVAKSGFRAGVYASGQLVQDDPGKWIDTVRDIRQRIQTQHLHEVAIFDTQDACPPAPGCTVKGAKPLSAAGEPDLSAWQYAQSPRRPEITKACAATYAADGNCYAPGLSDVFLDMDIASSADPSHGR